MSKRPVVVLLMRKASSDYYSIEGLFESLEPFLSTRFDVKVVRVPFQSTGFLHCAANLIFTAQLRADVIHVTGDIYYCALGIRRKRCVLTIHDLCSLNRLTGLRKRIFSLLWYSLPLRWASHVTAISEKTRSELQSTFPMAANEVKVIPNCVDEAFRRNPRLAKVQGGKPRVLQVGTGPNKNVERVAAAAADLDVQLRIIGSLSDAQRTLLYSLDLDWTSSERLAREELIKEYGDSDVLIFASTYEGFGLPIVEAQAIRLPVITSNKPPMTDTAGAGALLVDPYDEGEIRAALQQLLSSPDLVQCLLERGNCNAARFGAAAVADKYANVYLQTKGCGKSGLACAPSIRLTFKLGTAIVRWSEWIAGRTMTPEGGRLPWCSCMAVVPVSTNDKREVDDRCHSSLF